MIVILHDSDDIIEIYNGTTKEAIKNTFNGLSDALFQLAKKYKDTNTLIIWCHYALREHINKDGFQSVFHHHLIMASFEVRMSYYIAREIGYVESSPFINVNKKVNYPTWLMSSCIGGIYSKALLKFNEDEFKDESLDYTLNSIAKIGMNQGLFCYSSPKLLIPNSVALKERIPSINTLFKFIKHHYKSRWALLTFFNIMLYEKKVRLLPLGYTWFVTKKQQVPNFAAIKVASKLPLFINDIDVVIPTIGRKKYLYKVLKDLSKQTLLPKNVIIIEQNPDVDSYSSLDYINTEDWPFKIDHQFTHKAGACNARNLALKKVTSSWVFLADDDIRFSNRILKESLENMLRFGLKAATLSCLQDKEQEYVKMNKQWNTFGSGCSIVHKDVIDKVCFDVAFEFGFGEDADFGMQIRKKGYDIGFLPNQKLMHLKAPIGGFRTQFQYLWKDDKISPKPSPTVMLFNLKNQTICQIQGYKTILFLKYYKRQNIKNPFRYYKTLKKQWATSQFWANKLQETTLRR